ncbi:MFS transporter, partial [Mycolicibacterium confluentis]|uniref:MFS transporter n=1 Tax=Mycolicibacterium confluentis TaxID=28047 RepID=UPI001A99E538
LQHQLNLDHTNPTLETGGLRNGDSPVSVSFTLNGVFFATLVSRLPDVREGLDIGNGTLGFLLLMVAAGSLLGLPSSGRLTQMFGTGNVIRAGVLMCATGLIVLAYGAGPAHSVVCTAVALFVFGVGTGIWDVAHNIAGAEIEQQSGRTLLPYFHGAFSIGSIFGALLGVPLAAAHVALSIHVGIVALSCATGTLCAVRYLAPAQVAATRPLSRPRSAWREPRTLAIGAMVLAFAAVEGSANDWLALALIDGYGAAHWVGVAGFVTFSCAMAVGRFTVPSILDRWGRAPVLWASAACTAAGTLLVVFAGYWVVVLVGIVLWGFGASTGFPVGVSAAADDPDRAAARVSVVSTIGYMAFVVAPPLMGVLADRVGTLNSLLAITALMVPAAVSVLATRPIRDSDAPRTSQK